MLSAVALTLKIPVFFLACSIGRNSAKNEVPLLRAPALSWGIGPEFLHLVILLALLGPLLGALWGKDGVGTGLTPLRAGTPELHRA